MKPIETDDIPKGFKKWLKSTFVDVDKIDVFSHYDRSLTEAENQEIFMIEFQAMLSQEYKDKQARETAKAQIGEIKLILNKEKEIEKQKLEVEKQEAETELMEKWKEQEQILKADTHEFKEFEMVKHLTLMVAKGYSYSTIIFGTAGCGKTTVVIKTLLQAGFKNNEDFYHITGHITTLELYNFMYKHRRKILIIDDCSTIFDVKTQAILKGALWDSQGVRKIQYLTTSNKLEAPSEFIFEGSVIVLCNEVPDKDISTLAMLSRMNKYELNFSFSQKKKIIFELLKERDDITDKQKQLATEIINKVPIYAKNFNLRALEKVCSYIKYKEDLAEKLLFDTLEVDEEESVVWNLMNSDLKVKEQEIKFIEKTGMSRATFFRIKGRLKEKIGN